MKLSALFFALASATIALKHGVNDPSLENDPTTTWLTEVELDALENGTTLEARQAPPFNINIASTQCAAHPRGATRRSLDGIAGSSKHSHARRQTSQTCGTAPGCVTSPGPRTVIPHITQQRCANSCVCRGDTNGCMSFAWSANGLGFDRGLCILYMKTLADMNYMDGTCDANHPSRPFYSRACYHKGAPYPPSIVQTTMSPTATPPSSYGPPSYGPPSYENRKRDTELNDALRVALAGI